MCPAVGNICWSDQSTASINQIANISIFQLCQEWERNDPENHPAKQIFKIKLYPFFFAIDTLLLINKEWEVDQSSKVMRCEVKHTDTFISARGALYKQPELAKYLQQSR